MANSFKKYLRITGILVKNCFSKETAFRLPFLFWVMANLVWLWFALFSMDILFSQVPIIAGWTAGEGKILIVVHQIFATLIWIFIMPNLAIFWRLINQGTMDFHLLKPISARFLSSATYYEFDAIPRFVPIVIILYALTHTATVHPEISQWLLFLMTLILGVIIFYNFGFMVVTTCFWFTKIDSLEDFFAAGSNIGKYPSDVFKGAAKIIFSYIFPTIFIAVIPTMALLGKGSGDLLTICVIFVLLTTIVSQRFWSFALKRYASASS